MVRPVHWCAPPILGLVIPLLATSALGQVAFVSKPSLTNDSGPTGIAIGDFKNNQRVGLAVANRSGASTASIFQGVGNGTFGPKTDYTTGSGSNAVAVGDFRNIGLVDLAIVNENADTVTILLNNGAGSGTFTLGTTVVLDPASATDTIAVGDFDGDHNLDLAVASYNNNNISVFLGNGDGTFQAERTFPAGANPTGIVVADFNNDGAADIAVANSGSFTITVLIGDGSGTAFTGTNYSAYAPHGFPGPKALAVGDFNHDGYADLAVGLGNVSFASVLLNNGNGTFKPPVAYATAGDPRGIAVGDIDRNGKLALLAATNTDTLSVLLGNRDGTFHPQVPVSTGLVTSNSIAVGPLTGSQHADVAIPSDDGITAILIDDVVFADDFE